jgi:hypothetical protein
MVWDDPPGGFPVSKPAKPKKAPKVDKVEKKGAEVSEVDGQTAPAAAPAVAP